MHPQPPSPITPQRLAAYHALLSSGLSSLVASRLVNLTIHN